MNRSARLALAPLAMAAFTLACSGAAFAQATSTATDSTDMAASGTHGKRMKHSGAMKKGDAGQHQASDQNTARSSGAMASSPASMKGGATGSAMAASGTKR